MIRASNEWGIGQRVGVWGPTICFVLVVLAIALLARDALVR